MIGGRYLCDMRVEGKYFLYRDGDYPCGKEYILIPSGTDAKGRRQYTECEVFDGELPYSCRDWTPISGANTAPSGYIWYSNGKSRFDEKYKTALFRKEAMRR